MKKAAFSIPAVFFMLYLVSSCEGGYKKNSSHSKISDKSIKAGKLLAERYCQSCHLLPEPSMLDAKAWEDGVMPAMGPFLGVFQHGYQRYPSYKGDPDLSPHFYPDNPVVTSAEWQDIINYYASTSPDSLAGQERTQPVNKTFSLFSVHQPAYNYPSPAITWIRINEQKETSDLMFADLARGVVYRYNQRLQSKDSALTGVTIVDADLNSSPGVVCNIGVINPNNGRSGKLHRLIFSGNDRLKMDSATILGDLARPVQITATDMNNDGRTDYIISEFGHLNGALSWAEHAADGKYLRHLIKSQPGCIKTYIEDYNSDGHKDIWALFSQGNEGISLFTNKGNGIFEERQILRFPPEYGSTYFEFADFNKDGYRDILYTCGDNADYSMILKPYHGVYVFLNDGKDNFTRRYFYPVNGCYKAMARDFDGDGDLDIATIAFFADYERQADEGFIYLEQTSDLDFASYTLPECKKGRWLTMDAGDLDRDGKVDLVLGNFSIRPSIVPSAIDWQQGPVFLFLKNESK